MRGCLLCALSGNLACIPGMCPDWESNQRSFGSQASAQSTEAHQPGLNVSLDREANNMLFNYILIVW